MPTQTHVLEGPDLETLLTRVPDELGAEATIVGANKLRSGGLGGFFAKERFEVVVEVPTGVDAVASEATAPPLRPGRGRLHADGPEDLASRLPTDLGGFAGVLDRMVRDAGVEDGPAPGPTSPRRRATSDGEAAGFVPLAAPRIELPLTPEPAEVPVPVQPAVEQLARPRPTPPAREFLEAPVVSLPVQVPVPAPAAAPARARSWLDRIELPDGLAPVAGASREELLVRLLELMERLPSPAPLPRATGSVIAIVGPRADALALARRFAEEVGADPDDVVVASAKGTGRLAADRRIDGPERAVERRRSWRRRKVPTLVAVDAPAGPRGLDWASSVVDALEPTVAWGVVDAGRKPEDIRAWSDGLGGLDALAVTGVEDTCTPTTVLAAGLPVGLLDGVEATPLRWTELLARCAELAA